MKLFECQNCGQLVYFENTQCERCGHALGFIPDNAIMVTLQPLNDNAYTLLKEPDKTVYYCANHQQVNCNWLVETGGNTLCSACKLNHTIPDISQPENLERWKRIEIAKHRLVYSLLRLGLPVQNKIEDPQQGLEFNFLAPDVGQTNSPPVMTGHDHGDITLNVVEADDALRTEIREKMGEPYRTLLGHFRHEIGHYYFERIVLNSPDYETVRKVFGDETQDYGQALQNYYAHGAPADWQNNFISAYATAHPSEDWAETFAHYLHMIDTFETAYAFGLKVSPRAGQDNNLAANISFDPYTEAKFSTILEAWLPLTFAVNSINRSMGIDDLYPFVISPPAAEKLATIHQIISGVNSKKATIGQRILQMLHFSTPEPGSF